MSNIVEIPRAEKRFRSAVADMLAVGATVPDLVLIIEDINEVRRLKRIPVNKKLTSVEAVKKHLADCEFSNDSIFEAGRALGTNDEIRAFIAAGRQHLENCYMESCIRHHPDSIPPDVMAAWEARRNNI